MGDHKKSENTDNGYQRRPENLNNLDKTSEIGEKGGQSSMKNEDSAEANQDQMSEDQFGTTEEADL